MDLGKRQSYDLGMRTQGLLSSHDSENTFTLTDNQQFFCVSSFEEPAGVEPRQ